MFHCHVSLPEGNFWMKWRSKVAKKNWSLYEWQRDAKQRDKTLRQILQSWNVFLPFFEGIEESWVIAAYTIYTWDNAKPQHISVVSSLWINDEAVVAGKPHHEAWQEEQRFGWFVYCTIISRHGENLHLWHWFNCRYWGWVEFGRTKKHSSSLVEESWRILNVKITVVQYSASNWLTHK